MAISRAQYWSIGALGIGLMLVATWLVARGWLAVWGLGLVCVAAIALVAWVGAGYRRQPPPEDRLSRWRHLRRLREVHVATAPDGQVVLTLDLVEDAASPGPGVTLRCDSVGDLRIRQFSTWPLRFDFLVARELRPIATQAPRLQVMDRWDEVISFECAGVHEVTEPPAGTG